jgi:predicted ArsR family transcriptional regulator
MKRSRLASYYGSSATSDSFPELVQSGKRREIWLRHCPFREVAEAHRDVVCAVHLGLMQGALAEMRAPLTADRLEPFVEPSLCVARLGEPANRYPA